MLVKVSRWGNSAALRIPATALKASGFQIGQELNLEVSIGRLSLELPAANLEDLIARITPENRHNLPLDGPAAGNEAW
ncbi:AbrB/MazE/SpoVT family DNA-binding domain-containing protein [Duganella vulcania]|uniref:AbrB/MazE/SpoVT family DNA-binding domain-containing protein n=1 Tax=Duganella vulcania TaxID=2692166 RepID=A0A845GSQ3_9BURK|nr:AbrB/MazE/SpoVT family DNA-binding domain-containing protein [Duganella vulcania]MYM95609.1 AbrB/MazE/SpoVT family DNA-binding domain-containing protein [Duganella vulcania]